MSNWTHVAAIVRVDGIPGRVDLNTLATSVFGKTCLWEDDSSIWDDKEKNPDKYLYMGSEGSLQMSVWKEPDDGCMCLGSISIFGDLRDDYDAQAVVDWFQKCLSKLDMDKQDYPAFVRQATITADNEWNGTVNWTYRRKDD